MAYVGNAPARSFISFERQVFTIVNSQTAYALSHSVTNENDIRLVVNNVVQEPGSGKAYTATGTALTLSAALTNGTDEMYCVFLGRATATSAPGAGSIGTAQLASDSVTLAKMAPGTDGNIISYDASGNPVAVATGNDGQVLTSTGAGSPPVFETLPAGENNRPYVLAAMHPSGTATLSNETTTKVPFNQSLFNVDGTYSESDARWTPGVAGRYYIQAQIFIDYGNDAGQRMDLKIYVNGSRVVESRLRAGGDFQGASTALVNGIVTLDNNDYVEIFAFGQMGGNQNYDKDQNFTWFQGFKIANT